MWNYDEMCMEERGVEKGEAEEAVEEREELCVRMRRRKQKEILNKASKERKWEKAEEEIRIEERELEQTKKGDGGKDNR